MSMDRETKRNDVAKSDLVFAPDEDKATREAEAWKVLIVDDEEDVHAVTALALRNFSFEGRPLQLFHAYTGTEAIRIMTGQPDIAVILLDVVMESDDAGLLVAKKIRTELGNKLVRIVLRTGQAGLFPEQEVVVDYEINDYKTKTELTAQKLFLTLVGSLRSYRDLVGLDSDHRSIEEKLLATFSGSVRNYRTWLAEENNRRGSNALVGAGGSQETAASVEQFIEAVLGQATALLHAHQDAVFGGAKQSPPTGATNDPESVTESASMGEADFSEYEMTPHAETVSILRSLCEAGSLITLYFNQGHDFLMTTLLEVSPDGKTMVIEYGSNMEANRKLLQADKIVCASSKNKVKIRFTLDGVRPFKYAARDAFLAEVPASLFRLQRRDHYRLPASLANPIKARIPLRREDGSIRIAQAVLFDISGGGVSLVVALGDVNFEVDAQFFGVSIELAEVGLVTFDLRVRNICDITAPGGKILRRAGCEFIKLSTPTASLIQRYIIQTERDRLVRGF
jgi:c-di-GMP-binding flagellar brake protein YcgR/CheY-like chemotaxis protein